MDFFTRSWTIEEYRYWYKRLVTALVCVSIAMLLVSIKAFFQETIVVLRTPGIGESRFTKNAMDLASYKSIAISISHNLGDINRGNYDNQIKLLQSWLAPEVYTKLVMKVKEVVKKQIEEHEAGSQYFEFNPNAGNKDEYVYDPDLDMHFVRGRMHFVNAAKDSVRPIVFSYKFVQSDYLPKITELYWEFGDVIKDTQYFENQRRGNNNIDQKESWSKNQDPNGSAR